MEKETLEYFDSRLELTEIKNDYNLAVHKRDTTEITSIAILTAIAAAIFALVDLILGCPCDLCVQQCILMTFKIFNLTVIIGTLTYNIAKISYKFFLHKFKKQEENAVQSTPPIQEQIDCYKTKIQKIEQRLKKITTLYRIAYFAIAAVNILLLILAFTIK